MELGRQPKRLGEGSTELHLSPLQKLAPHLGDTGLVEGGISSDIILKSPTPGQTPISLHTPTHSHGFLYHSFGLVVLTTALRP